MVATILLVDADRGNCSDWKAFLQSQGYEVVEAESGRGALERCLRLKPDLVLLSSSLPDMQGFQVCERLKSDPQNRLTPVIMIAPDSEPFEAYRAYQAGADDYWNKPTSRWDALSRLHSILLMKSYIDQQAEGVLFALARSIESKSAMSSGHSERLSEYAVQFGELLGLSSEELEVLREGSLLHDIGKVAVPDHILLKPGRLTPTEMEIMRQHPVVGEEICAPLKSFRHVLPVIRHHHERADGSGYPDGLRGDAIPLAAQILQMADIYDALTTDRPYRKAMPVEEALTVMNREARCGQLSETLFNEFSLFVWTKMPWRRYGDSMPNSSRIH